jgi:hypothetical protein
VTSLAGPEFVRERAERELERERAVIHDSIAHSIDPQSSTWKSLAAQIRIMVADSYQPVLRSRTANYEDTQYARGAIDALETVLELGGETI